MATVSAREATRVKVTNVSGQGVGAASYCDVRLATLAVHASDQPPNSHLTSFAAIHPCPVPHSTLGCRSAITASSLSFLFSRKTECLGTLQTQQAVTRPLQAGAQTSNLTTRTRTGRPSRGPGAEHNHLPTWQVVYQRARREAPAATDDQQAVSYGVVRRASIAIGDVLLRYACINGPTLLTPSRGNNPIRLCRANNAGWQNLAYFKRINSRCTYLEFAKASMAARVQRRAPVPGFRGRCPVTEFNARCAPRIIRKLE
ncbi:hypothetical protein LXA43DRAFT_1014189 [Ganoderma leucocontextum]|nr:hypothetical protein LXA43DRAFT_1014189 [Ganoderma leucocontextum]